MTRPSDIKKAFDEFCESREVALEQLRERQAIELIHSFYKTVPFDGRRQDSHEDVLSFSTNELPDGDRWTSSVRRRLYKNGRGVELRLTWTYGRPLFVQTTLISSKDSNAATWAASAVAEADNVVPSSMTPRPVEVSLEQL